jgi:hypothetical protein
MELDDFFSKWGFGDGAGVPAEAEALRSVIVRLLNIQAAALSSSVRAAVYDRPGVHNYCLIVYAPVSWLTSRGIAMEALT